MIAHDSVTGYTQRLKSHITEVCESQKTKGLDREDKISNGYLGISKENLNV